MAKPMAIVLQTVNQMVEYAFCPQSALLRRLGAALLRVLKNKNV